MRKMEIKKPETVALFRAMFGHIPPVPYELIRGITMHTDCKSDAAWKRDKVTLERALKAQQKNLDDSRLMRNAKKTRGILLALAEKKTWLDKNQIGVITGISSRNIHNMIGRLEGNGLVKVRVSKRKNLTRHYFSVTEKGLGLSEEIIRDML